MTSSDHEEEGGEGETEIECPRSPGRGSNGTALYTMKIVLALEAVPTGGPIMGDNP